MKTKKAEATNYRILSQIHYFNADGNRISANAGEPLPVEVLNNADLLKTLLDSERICKIDAEGNNIVKKNDLDANGREVFDNNFLCGLINPSGVNLAIKYLQEKRICLSNLKAMNAKVLTVLATINTPVLKMLEDEISKQIYDIQIIEEFSASEK